MTGYDLRLWRKGLGWSRDKAAEELGVSLRTFKRYENSPQLNRHIALATVTLSIQNQLPLLGNKSPERIVQFLNVMIEDAVQRG